MKIFGEVWVLFDRGKCKGKGEWFSSGLSKSLWDWNQLPRSSLATENKCLSFWSCGYSAGSLSHIKLKLCQSHWRVNTRLFFPRQWFPQPVEPSVPRNQWVADARIVWIFGTGKKLLRVSEFWHFMHQNRTAHCPCLLIIRVEKEKRKVLKRTYYLRVKFPHFHSQGTSMETPPEWDFRTALCAKLRQVTTEQRFQSKLQGHTVSNCSVWTQPHLWHWGFGLAKCLWIFLCRFGHQEFICSWKPAAAEQGLDMQQDYITGFLKGKSWVGHSKKIGLNNNNNIITTLKIRENQLCWFLWLFQGIIYEHMDKQLIQGRQKQWYIRKKINSRTQGYITKKSLIQSYIF